jgi:hypothetical protein
LAVALAPLAAAGGNVVFRDHFTFKDSHIEQVEHGADFCPDVPFLVLWEGRGTITEMAVTRGDDDLEYFRFHVSDENRYTNTETGASFRDVNSFSSKDQKLAFDEDGNLVIDGMDRFSSKLFDQNGRLVAVASGLVAFHLVIDLNDLEDPDDDVVLEETITKDHGPRGFDGHDFCTDVLAFLG